MSLHIETVGQGPDLALIHGWGMHGGVWNGVCEALAPHFRLHIVDLPGYGESAAVEAVALDSIARLVAAALPSKVHVCGWSLGGEIALEMALMFPDQVDHLILTSSTPCFTTREDWPWAVSREVLLEFAASMEADYEGTLKRFLALQTRGGEKGEKSVLKQLRDILFTRGRPDLPTLRAGLNILLESDLRNRALTLQTPTLLLHGERDMLTPVGAAQWLAAHMPNAKLEVIADAAHAPFLSHTEVFSELVMKFLKVNND